jgi:FkbM family methyltransferase
MTTSHENLLKLRLVTRLLARIRGGRRVTSLVRSWYSGRREVIRVGDVDGDLKFDCRLDSHISGQIFWDGFYSRSQLRLLERLLQPDWVYVDAGANEGEQTLFAAKRLPRGRVIAFEPSTEIRARLTGNVAANGFTNVTIERFALADAPGELPLFRAPARYADGSFNEGLSTLHPRGAADALEEVVSVVTLDAYFAASPVARLDVMKVDVEGAEHAVIRGGAATIDRFRPFIILEVVDETNRAAGHTSAELLELVRGHGYVVHDIDRRGRVTPTAARPTRDVLCVPKEKLGAIR